MQKRRLLPPAVKQLTEATSIAFAEQIQWLDIQTTLHPQPIATSYVCAGAGTPILLIHGFDSSVFEFRRLLPLLASRFQVWAVDLLGFGFTERTLTPDISPTAIKHHLHCFIEQAIAQPVILAGASMGGAAAIDFALTYPDWVTRLVLIDSAGFAAGPAMGRLMVPPFDGWATGFLQNPKVRQRISEQAYCDRTLATPDATCCAALHLAMPNWQSALIAFTKSNGYNFLTRKIQAITPPTLILWGENDKILGTKDATKFQQTIAQSTLKWIPQCGHVPHLETPTVTAAAIEQFCLSQP
jgi:pimeloyl-ACP methyl ester carboxylesterase